MTARPYTVEGMTCQHCLNTVSGEVGQLPGVTDVTVDLAGKTVTVTGAKIDDAAVRAAVGEAGYRVTS